MARPLVRPLPVTGAPTDVLRRLRGEPGLVALVGDWCGGGAVLAWEPAEVLAADADPFDLPLPGVSDAGAAAFGGGWVALWGYQLNRRLEAVPAAPPRPRRQPDHWCARYDWVVRYDADDGAWAFETLLPAELASAAGDRVLERLLAGSAAPLPYRFDPFVMDPGPAAYRGAVTRARELIHRGDIFQANICTGLVSRLDGDPIDAFCAGVDALAPAYAAYVDTGDRQIVSLSPELFLRRDGREVVTRPIKGTAATGQDPALLSRSAKDRAENVMIADLMRNDLGRVCAVGTVRVPRLALPEEGVGVRHLVSEVRGTLPSGATDADLLRATFPPGSVTGAPKVRAMEVIHQLEATGRELYTGSVGYLSPVAGLEASVVIRTFEIGDGDCWVGVGSGIVADSQPDAEVSEAFTKVDPLLHALGATRTGPVAPTPTATGPRAVTLPPAPPVDAPVAGQGVFETLLVRHGVAVDLDAHLDRLARSVADLYGAGLDRAPLEHAVRREAADRVGPARLRVTWSPDGHDGPVVRVESEPIEEPRLAPRRLAVATVPGGLGAHKWADRRFVDRSRAGSGDADDVLLVDGEGRLLECGTANVFAVLDGEVVTPPLDGRILPGVVRSRVLELLRDRGIPVVERPVALAELERAREVFTTSSVSGVQPVLAVLGTGGTGSWRVGRTTGWVRETLGRDPHPARTVANRRTDARVLILDNYDSFTYNLAQRLRGLGAAVEVVRNDRIGVAALRAGAADGSFTHLVISPGPGSPDDAGISVAAVRAVGAHIPVLGVCLGHQSIGQAYGARVVRAPWPVHGQASLVHHDGLGVYAGLDGPLVAGRYHSLVLADLPAALVATAWTADGILMGVRHARHPVEGVQVHPESILTPRGSLLLSTFLGASHAPKVRHRGELTQNSSWTAS